MGLFRRGERDSGPSRPEGRVIGIAAYSTAAGTLTTTKNGCANPLADGLSLRRRPLGRRLKGVRFVSETEETGGKRWRAHHLIRNLLAERHRGTPILFRTAKQVQS